MLFVWKVLQNPITVQDCIANCIAWVPRLTLLDLWTNWIDKPALGMELTSTEMFWVGYLQHAHLSP